MKGLALLLVFSLNAAAVEPTGIYPLRATIDLQTTDQELQPLDALIAGARVIGLGETEHGTQSDLVRHRIVRYLVEKHGYRAILAEQPLHAFAQPEMQNFLFTCQGDARALLEKYSFWEFNTQEYLDFLTWICRFNQDHPADPVRFYGVDIGYAPWLMRKPFETLTSLFPSDLGLKTMVENLLASCFGLSANSDAEMNASLEGKYFAEHQTLPADLHQNCLSSLSDIKTFVKTHTAEIRRLVTPLAATLIELTPGIVNVHEMQYSDRQAHFDRLIAERDLQMGRNFLGLNSSENADCNTIFMAHNFHIAKAQSQTELTGWYKNPSAAEFLIPRLGKDYRSIGMTGYAVESFSRGKFRQPTAPSSLDLQLSQQDLPAAIIDPRGEFVAQNQKWHVFASNDSDNPQGMLIDIAQNFDGLIYLRDSPPSHDLGK